MKNSIIAILLFTFSSSGFSQTKEIIIESKIDHVTVFLSGAQIERSAKKSLTKGVYNLVFTGLSSNLNINSTQFGGKGNFTILSVSHRQNYFNPAQSSPKVQALRDSILILKDKLWYQQELKVVYQEERNLITANKNVMSNGSAGFEVGDVENLANLYRKRLTELMKLKMAITKKEKVYNKKINILQAQMNQLSRKAKYTQEIIVEVAVKQNTKATFDIKYLVNGASWSPTYDIRANGVNEAIKLIYNAQVIQNTGINWNKVNLSLSTNNPYISAIKPNLSPWRLNFVPEARKYEQDKLYSQSNRSTSYKTKNDGIVGNNAVKMKSAAQSYKLTTVTESDLNFAFDISIPYNIPSDNKKHKVNVRKESMKTDFSYFTVPKKKTSAYLVGSVPDWENLQLMSGSANVYLKGTFIGQSFIDTKNTKDTLQISLGADNQVIVSRKRIEDFCKTKAVGSNKTETIGLEVSVKNTKMTAIKIVIEEQIPISSNSDIIVNLEEKSGAKYNAKTGFLTWELELKPGETKSLVFKYSVKFPKDRKINL